MFETTLRSILWPMHIGRKARIGAHGSAVVLAVSLVVALVVGQAVAQAEPQAGDPASGPPVAIGDGQPRERLELLAPARATGDRFGYSIAIDGDTAVIGAPGYDRNRGAVYVSTFSDGAWGAPALVASGVAVGDELGCAVDIDGGTMIVGAWGASAFRGEAYVIERQPDGSWGPRTFIARGDVGAYNSPTEGLGKAVAIDGDTALMSAPWAERTPGDFQKINTGAVYRCTRDAAGSWGSTTRVITGPESGVHMGMSIALQGNTLVCGNSADQTAAGANAGSIHVYERLGAAWVRTAQYNGATHSQLGSSVDISGDTILFGGRFYGGGGRVFAIDRTGSAWTASPVAVASGTGDDQIGYSVDIEGNRAVVGAMKADGSVLNVGGFKVLTRRNGVWSASSMIRTGDAADDAYGSAIALRRGTVLIGGPAANFAGVADTGAVRVFDGSAYATTEDSSLGIGSELGLLFNDYDSENATLTPTLVDTSALHGTIALGLDGAFTYAPDKDFNGVATATYRVSDGAAESGVATITITVAPVNDAPVALDDTATVLWRQTLVAPSVLVNDTDIDGDTLVASIETRPAHGALSMALDGSYIYIAQAGFIGTDTFTYRVTDTKGAYDIATVAVAVTRSADSAPVARSDETTAAEDGVLGLDILANDTKDEAVGSLEATGFSEPAHGSLQISPSGEVTYTPDADWNGEDTFTYRAFDGGMYSEFATVTVNVASVNDRPFARDDNAGSSRNQPITISVLGNDADVDTEHASLVIGDHSTATSGTVTVASATRLTYTPVRNFVGTDTFTYRVFDGELYSKPATVTVTVSDANQAPVLTPAAPEIGSGAAGTQAVPGGGATVASVLGGSVADADGDDVGMAVYAMKLRSGVWQYSLDSGSTWADMVSASTDGALLLGPTDKIRFLSYFNTGSTQLSYRAWDGTSGTAGTHVAIDATGGNSAFSTQTDIGALDVDLPWDDKVGRLWGRDRYATSVATARYASHDWTDITDIVLVSGADANASDPLAAAGLVWAYRGAPMIQTSPKTLPSALAAALHEIADKNDTVRLHVVGGSNALPETRIAEIEALLSSRGVTVSHDRIAGANRYDTAARIAAAMVELRGSEMSGDVLVAHGADRTRFFDALALSPIAATQGSPILLTAPAALSAETSSAIDALDPDRVIVAGGTAVVSQAAFDQVPAAAKVRWAGTSRFDTAIVISDHAIEEGMLSARTVSVCSARPDASSLPDALASTGVSSRDASPLLLTQTSDTPAATSAWLAANKSGIRHIWLVGGPNVITYDQEGRIGDLLK